MTMLRVLLFSGDYLPNIGGVAVHVHELAKAIAGLGHDVRVISIGRASWSRPWSLRVKRTANDGIPLLRVPLAIIPPGGWGAGALVRHAVQRLFRQLSAQDIPIVFHCHDYEIWGHAVAAACPTDARIFTNHTSMFLRDVELGNRNIDWKQRLAIHDQIIAPSRELAEKTIAAGAVPEKVHYIPNGVDPERFRPDATARAALRKRLAIPEDAIVFVCARRVHPKNGVIDFAHALHFLKHGAKVWAVFIGNSADETDPYVGETACAAYQSPIRDRVRFLGKITNAEMPAYYAASDVSVLPSLKEAVSISCLESMACGLPIIATRVGGLPDLVVDGKNGLLVQAGDPRGLAAAVDRFVTEDAVRRQFGEAARQHILEGFTWRHIATQTLEVYARSLGTSATSGHESRKR